MSLPTGMEVRRCWCCGVPLMDDGRCAVCDLAGLVSPPHFCLRLGELIGDEHGCPPEWPRLAADHETALRPR